MKSERISPFWVNGYQPFSALSQFRVLYNKTGLICNGPKLYYKTGRMAAVERLSISRILTWIETDFSRQK